MQERDDNPYVGSSRLPGSDQGSFIRFQPSAKLREKFKKLERWRMNPSSIKFREDADEFYGGHSIVLRGQLTSPLHEELGMDECEKITAVQKPGGGTLGQKAVAVKKLKIADDTDLERILGLALREAEFLVELSHPNIVSLKGFVEDVPADIIWLVFSWEDNGNLREFIASRVWEVPERIWLIDDVTRGVEYLHSQKPPIRHGDLKSLNILVNAKYNAVITDFGSACRLTNGGLKQTETKLPRRPPLQATFCVSTNTITLTCNDYTLRWAAPELLMEDQPGLWSDVWSLGWIYYEVMTNSIPFQDVHKDAVIIKRVVQGDLPSIYDDARMSLIQALCSLMTECWSIEPGRRPTAEDCRKSIHWMPMTVPNPTRSTDAAVPGVRSPELLVELGYMHKRQSDYLRASTFFTEALEIYTDMAHTEGRASALWALAEVHRLQDEYNQAVIHYTQTLKVYTEVGDTQEMASCLWGLAEVHRLRNEYTEAVTHYTAALQIYTEIDDGQGRAYSLWGLAQVHRLQAEYNKAVTFYSEGLQICTETGDREGRASALWGLAEVHQDRYTEATTLYSEALQVYTDIGDKDGRGCALWGLAQVHQAQNESSQAITCYSEALQICIETGDKEGRASTLWGIAEVHRQRNEHGEAFKLHSEALKIYTDIGSNKGRADALGGLAYVHQHLNEYEEAITLYSKALEIYSDIGDKRGRADVLRDLAQVNRDQRHLTDAIHNYEQAAEIFGQIGNTEAAAGALKDAANLRQSLEQKEAA